MKIVMVAERYPPALGGVASSAGRISRALARLGHELHVFAHARELPGGMVHSEELASGLTLHRLGAARSLDFTLQQSLLFLEWLHSRQRFELVWGHYLTTAGFLGTWFGESQSIPSLVSVRGNDLDKQLFPGGDFARLRWCLERATTVVAVSRDLARKVRTLTGRVASVLPNAVDTQLFSPGAKPEQLAQKHGWPAGELILGFCGELRAKKGLPFLLQAFRTLATRQPTRLLIIGQVRGEDLGEFERALADGGLAGQITITGHLDRPEQVADYLRCADVALLPSLWDGLPNSLLEAMAAGIPVIASDAGAIPEVLVDGVTGTIIPRTHLHQLAQRVEEWLAAPGETRATRIAAAREYVCRNHSLDAEESRLKELLNSLPDQQTIHGEKA